MFWVIKMISYKPLFEQLARKGITEYALIYKHGLSANTIHRLKHGMAISTKTLDTLCFILECEVQEILQYQRET